MSMISDYNVQPYMIKFHTPINVGHKQLSTKKGFYLNIVINNKEFTGELSFLESFHYGTLDDCLKRLKSLLNYMKGKSFTGNIDFLSPGFGMFGELDWNAIHSPIVFALESALLHYIKESHIDLFTSYFGKISEVETNALVFPPENGNISNNLENYKAIKVKIGRLEPTKEADILNALFQKYPKAKFRLDGNRLMTPQKLGELVSRIDHARIEYIEEPFKEISQWNSFYDQIQVPLALDESLPSLFTNYAPFPKGTTHWVLKPTLVGGISGTLQLIEDAQKENAIAVISSTFETKTGLEYLKILATKQNMYQEVPHGLDTLSFIEYVTVGDS